MASSPTWYELLGVRSDATPAQIKAAWRAATDSFEPGSGSGQFRLFNEAADVLLDPESRAAYDAELSPADPEVTTESQPEQVVSLDKGSADSIETPAAADASTGLRLIVVLTSTLVSIVLAGLTVAAFSVGGVLWYQNHRHDQQTSAGQEAAAAAQRALPAVLSYDYRHLSTDRDRAVRFLAPRYRKEYTATFDKLIESSDGKPGPARQTSAVVKATVRSVGVVDAEADLAKVIVFVDQATVKDGGSPKYSLNRLTVSMVKSGNSWLVNNINSY